MMIPGDYGGGQAAGLRQVNESGPVRVIAVAFRRLASDAEHWLRNQLTQGQLQFFFARLVQVQTVEVAARL